MGELKPGRHLGIRLLQKNHGFPLIKAGLNSDCFFGRGERKQSFFADIR
jgi:hypothetical protein